MIIGTILILTVCVLSAINSGPEVKPVPVKVVKRGR